MVPGGGYSRTTPATSASRASSCRRWDAAEAHGGSPYTQRSWQPRRSSRASRTSAGRCWWVSGWVRSGSPGCSGRSPMPRPASWARPRSGRGHPGGARLGHRHRAARPRPAGHRRRARRSTGPAQVAAGAVRHPLLLGRASRRCAAAPRAGVARWPSWRVSRPCSSAPSAGQDGTLEGLPLFVQLLSLSVVSGGSLARRRSWPTGTW